MMAENWRHDLEQPENIITDLNRMELSAYAGIYQDINQNGTVDFSIDSLIQLWAYRQDTTSFDYLNYWSAGDKDFIVDSLQLEPLVKTPYISYGLYGENEIPAHFLEFPIKNNQIIAYWLIADYPLPVDRDWPSIILPISIIIILSLVFWIISSFLYPIKLMQQHVRDLKKGSLNKKIDVTSTDELGELASTINQMTADINLLINQKDDLLLDVSHELKTPLTRLKFILANTPIEEQYKTKLNKEINMLKDMISNMLLSDKLSTPYIEDLDKSWVEIERLIKETCDMFYKIEEKMVIKNLLKTSKKIKIDKYRISLAIKNLIDNALKYTEQKVSLIELIITEDQNNVYFTVKDFGIGMHKEQIKKIIKPLYRGRTAKEKSKSGFGLGLAITKKIIEAHEGQLKITSVINKGSEFTLSIPKEV